MSQWSYMYQNQRWRNMRKQFLRAHPFCVYCYAPANVVDHIKPHKGDYDLFWNVNNWQSCCSPCHNSVKARIDNGKDVKKIDASGSPEGEAWG